MQQINIFMGLNLDLSSSVQKAGALEKVRKIDQRFEEIDEEKRLTLLALEGRGTPEVAVARRATRRSSVAPVANTGAFKIRY